MPHWRYATPMPDNAASAQADRCENCHKTLPAEAIFCPACGHSITDGGGPFILPAAVPARSEYIAEQWNAIRIVIWLFGLLLASSLVLGITHRFVKSPMPEAVISGIDAAIVLTFLILRYRNTFLLLRIPRLAPAQMLELIAIALACGLAISLYFALIQHFGIRTIDPSTEFRKAGWGIGLMLLFVSIMPAIFEELAFRGVIQSSLEEVFDSSDAWIIQAALFSVLHLLPINFPSHFLMGLCLGYARNRSRSLYPGMLMHASWNAFVLLRFLNVF
ncbi:MAG: CPBP family intramembrane glutamic endopeptidase [Rhizomicrobium sp.]|jgi:membrane protease YdiL (CAAX protease family)